MSRSFDVSTESSASVEQIHAAFGREDYWLARIDGPGDITLDSLVVDDDGTVTVRVTQHIGRQLLPGLATKFVKGDLKFVHDETWQPNGHRQVRGVVSITASGGLGSGHVETLLAPTDDGGCQVRSALRVEVKIPLVGGRFEKAIGADLAAGIPEILRFTTTWIVENT